MAQNRDGYRLHDQGKESNELIILKYQKSVMASVMVPWAERKKNQHEDVACRIMFSGFSFLFVWN